MSSPNRVINVGAGARASDVQKIADIASAADDRAMEILVTPGAAQKKIVPLSEESSTVNPRLLIVGKDTDGTLVNGKVRVRPAHFVAGVVSDPNTIGLAGKLDALLDSAVFGNNSSGSTRTDLLYATLSYGTAVTASVRQKPTAGGTPVSTTLTVENDITITLTIVPGVASGSPLASLPADSGSGKAAVYNFALAAVSIANGFSGGAINQASIAPLWTGGWTGKVRGFQPGGIYSNLPPEIWGNPLSSRAGADARCFVHLKVLSSTGTTVGTGVVLDDKRAWNERLITVTIAYLGTALNALENGGPSNAGAVVPTVTGVIWPAGGGTSSSVVDLQYSSTSGVKVAVDSTGRLVLFKHGSVPVDATNGDGIAVFVEATDQFLATT